MPSLCEPPRQPEATLVLVRFYVFVCCCKCQFQAMQTPVVDQEEQLGTIKAIGRLINDLSDAGKGRRVRFTPGQACRVSPGASDPSACLAKRKEGFAAAKHLSDSFFFHLGWSFACDQACKMHSPSYHKLTQ